MNNLGSTVMAGSAAGLLATLVGPIIRARYGVDFTVDQIGAAVGLGAGLLHELAALPGQAIAWRAAWRTAAASPPPQGDAS